MHLFTLPIRFLINLIQWLRRCLYRKGILKSVKLPGYVLSVGNVEFGGTGKTPLVIHVLEKLVSEGFKPVVLSRGYMSSLSKDAYSILLDGQVVAGCSIENCDEPILISKRLPRVAVIVGRNRVKAAHHYLESVAAKEKPTHWVLDDGFQHLKIQRDFDICLVTGGFLGKSFWFRSPSREFLSARNNADLVLTTKSKEKHAISNYCDFEIDFIYKVGSSEHLEPNQQISLFAGIAQPDFLVSQLVEYGFEIMHQLILPDHHRIKPDNFKTLSNYGLPLVMTEKDYYRQAKFFLETGAEIYIIRQKVRVAESLIEEFIVS